MSTFEKQELFNKDIKKEKTPCSKSFSKDCQIFNKYYDEPSMRCDDGINRYSKLSPTYLPSSINICYIP